MACGSRATRRVKEQGREQPDCSASTVRRLAKPGQKMFWKGLMVEPGWAVSRVEGCIEARRCQVGQEGERINMRRLFS